MGAGKVRACRLFLGGFGDVVETCARVTLVRPFLNTEQRARFNVPVRHGTQTQHSTAECEAVIFSHWWCMMRHTELLAEANSQIVCAGVVLQMESPEQMANTQLLCTNKW